MKSVAILVDGANIHAVCVALGFMIDWKKVVASVNEDMEVHSAQYFTAMKPLTEVNRLKPMVDYLEYNGWTVIQKPTESYMDPTTGRAKIKGNMDVEIAVCAMQLAPHVSDVMLFTGDGDFKYLVEVLQTKGIRVTVVSTLKTKVNMCSDKLRRQANVFVDITDMKDVIQREVSDIEDRRRKFVEGT